MTKYAKLSQAALCCFITHFLDDCVTLEVTFVGVTQQLCNSINNYCQATTMSILWCPVEVLTCHRRLNELFLALTGLL